MRSRSRRASPSPRPRRPVLANPSVSCRIRGDARLLFRRGESPAGTRGTRKRRQGEFKEETKGRLWSEFSSSCVSRSHSHLFHFLFFRTRVRTCFRVQPFSRIPEITSCSPPRMLPFLRIALVVCLTSPARCTLIFNPLFVSYIGTVVLFSIFQGSWSS